jgi:predicted Ser/Thr protein kinase
VSLPKDGLVSEYLRSEGQSARSDIRSALAAWQALPKPRPPLGLYLVEREAISVAAYVKLVSALSRRIQPCASCQAPRYVPRRAEGASPCRACGFDRPPPALSDDESTLSFADYSLEKALGQGAMGVVYRARYGPASRLEALKVMLPRHNNARRVARFEREIEVLARLRHRNVIGVYRAGEFAGLRYLALHYIEGGELKDLMGSPMALNEALRIASELADGLHAAHQAGVIHRDLKPANILIANDGTPLLADLASRWTSSRTSA